jgi:hypothetical protein
VTTLQRSGVGDVRNNQVATQGSSVDHETILQALHKFSEKDSVRRLPSASVEAEGEGAGDVGYG